MKKYNILVYSDFFYNFEIIETDIPKEEITHFLFMYTNYDELGIDMDNVIHRSSYQFKTIASSQETLLFDDIKKYNIDDSLKFCTSDFVMKSTY